MAPFTPKGPCTVYLMIKSEVNSAIVSSANPLDVDAYQINSFNGSASFFSAPFRSAGHVTTSASEHAAGYIECKISQGKFSVDNPLNDMKTCRSLLKYSHRISSIFDTTYYSIMKILKQPLLDYLQCENPVLFCDRCPGGANTSSKPKTYLYPRQIDKWEDFDYDSLRSIYGGALHRVLEREFSCKDFSTIPRLPFREPSDENSLETLLTVWNQCVISQALLVAQQCLYNPTTSKNIYMAKGGQAYFPESKKYRPDWAGIQPRPFLPQMANLDCRSKNVLPGDTKISTKWSSRDIVEGPVQSEYTTKDWLRPFSQVYTYCVKANARYGYIITDKELVAIRVRPYLDTEGSQPANDSQGSWQELTSTQEDSQKSPASIQETKCSQECDTGIDSALSSPTLDQMLTGGRLEYKAIPWSNANSRRSRRRNDLTVNLALWWLHIMASVSSNIKEQYPPLKEIAQPAFFGEENSSFALSETSENLRPKLPIRSRKRSCSILSDEGNMSDGSSNGYPADIGRSPRGMKRFKTEDDGSQNRRQTRSMLHSQT